MIKYALAGDDLKKIKKCLKFCKSIRSIDNPDDHEKARDLNAEVADILVHACIQVCVHDTKMAAAFRNRAQAHRESEYAFNTCLGIYLYRCKGALQHCCNAHSQAAIMHENCGLDIGFAEMHYGHAIMLQRLMETAPEEDDVDDGFDITSEL
jgi:hypothetical protein